METASNLVTRSEFEGWRNRVHVMFDVCLYKIWERHYWTVVKTMKEIVHDDDLSRQITAEAYWQAMEELDIMISGGYFLIDENGRGKVSRRSLSDRDPFVWRDSVAFHAFALKIWVLRAHSIRRPDWRMQQLPVDAEGNSIDIPDENEEHDPFLQVLKEVLKASSISMFECLIENLLRQAGRCKYAPAQHEFIWPTVLYIKWRIALCNTAWSSLSDLDLSLLRDDLDLRNQFLQSIKPLVSVNHSELLSSADLSQFSISLHQWNDFLLVVKFPPATDEEKEAAAQRWIAANPISASVSPVSCKDVQDNLSKIVKHQAPYHGKTGDGAAQRAAVAVHIQTCSECRPALGRTVIFKRNDDTIASNRRHARPRLVQALADCLAGLP